MCYCIAFIAFIPLENKKGMTIANAFQKRSDESKWKLNKIWVDKDSEF